VVRLGDRKETEMRKVIVNEWVTLDGVMRAPGYADEDTTGGFERGGWHPRHFDDISRNWVVAGYEQAGGFLLGRRTYESLASYWPNAAEEEQAVDRPLNTLPKYVASATLTDPLQWQNSTVLNGDVAEAVAALKRKGRRRPACDRQQRADAHAGRTRPYRRVPGDDRPGRGRRRQAHLPR
jgi:dihydrofolate reductase